MANTYSLIQGYTLGSDVTGDISFTSIPQTYTHLIFSISARSGNAGVGDDLRIIINNNTSATYTNIRMFGEFASGSFIVSQDGGSSSGASSNNYIGALTGDGASANTFASEELFIPNYTTNFLKNGYSDSSTQNNSTAASQWSKQIGVIRTSDTAPITSIQIRAYNSTTMKTGSTLFLYGLAST